MNESITGSISLDDRLYADIKERGLGFTICPLQNASLCSCMKAKEIKQMLDDGMLVTINSDDPAYFHGYIADNSIALQQAVELRKQDLEQLSRNAFNIAWLSQAEKDTYLSKVTDYINGYSKI